jgi:hypothetical protein
MRSVPRKSLVEQARRPTACCLPSATHFWDLVVVATRDAKLLVSSSRCIGLTCQRCLGVWCVDVTGDRLAWRKAALLQKFTKADYALVRVGPPPLHKEVAQRTLLTCLVYALEPPYPFLVSLAVHMHDDRCVWHAGKRIGLSKSMPRRR